MPATAPMRKMLPSSRPGESSPHSLPCAYRHSPPSYLAFLTRDHDTMSTMAHINQSYSPK